MSQPYTFAEHMAFCCSEGREGRMASGRLVQVKKRQLVYCARIVNLWTAPNGMDCWTVEAFEPEKARFTVPCKQVRLCSGPGCTCEAQPAPVLQRGPACGEGQNVAGVTGGLEC